MKNYTMTKVNKFQFGMILMKSCFKRGSSLFVVLVILVSLMPLGVIAEEVNNENYTSISNFKAESPTLKTGGLKTGKIETIKEGVTVDGYLTKEVKVPLIQEGAICSEDTIETDQLDSDLEKEIKDKIFNALLNRDKDLNLVDYQIQWAQSGEISRWFFELINDNPRFFYVNSLIKLTGNSETSDVITIINFNYIFEPNEVIKYENAIQDILSYAKDEMSQAEKLLAVHDAFIGKVEYDYENYNKGTIPQEDYTAYGALVNGKAVCSGYSLAFYDIVKRLGIDVICVSNSIHMWNMVKVDGSWYHIDTTWDDPNGHSYFLISDEKIKLIGGDGHDYWSSSSPKADNTKYENYILFQVWSNLYYEAGKWIFIKDYKIHSSKFDGSEDSVLVDAGYSEPISFLTKWKDKLYYFKGNNYDDYGPVDRIKIFSCNYDGSNIVLFCPVPLQNSEYINYYANANNNSTILFNIANGSQVTEHQIDLDSQIAIDSNVTYRTHVQNVGWQGYSYGGGMSGTSGKGLRLEGIEININKPGYAVGVEYSTHVENIGWQDFVKDGTLSGTSGKSLRLEAIKIKLTGADANKYDIYYQVHAENFGWLGWAKNGASAGTEGFAYRLEAIKIVVVPKGSAAPGSTVRSFVKNVYCSYQTHVENIGWQGWKSKGEISGTSGKALRLEGIEIKTSDPTNLGIEYQTHVQNIGWQGFKSNGAISGTSGKSLRLEAIQMKLTGTYADKYDIYYQVHAQNYGWLGWAKNGASAGTEGFAYRLEAIKIVVVPKGSAAPGSTVQPFVKK